jgi:hypothetical protein
MFVHFNNKIVNTDIIACITCDDYVEHNLIHVHYKNSEMESVKAMEAANLIMALCPAVLDGMRAKHVKHSWAIHNLFAHPLMQILMWLGLTRWAMWVHDSTVPEPLEPE